MVVDAFAVAAAFVIDATYSARRGRLRKPISGQRRSQAVFLPLAPTCCAHRAHLRRSAEEEVARGTAEGAKVVSSQVNFHLEVKALSKRFLPSLGGGGCRNGLCLTAPDSRPVDPILGCGSGRFLHNSINRCPESHAVLSGRVNFLHILWSSDASSFLCS